ncbi:hypothetical protein G5B47_20520 [Paenibacillus sp. 7124]|uniref:Phospholipase C/D domain-containing protein n=1 Tax=Paenibacillus apii TaxID=1850370 RepID=A0A6M1PX90_9BACL|nr:hypothetical protein [Paenibacillus apii]NGM84791.1 hypothetical protein [Paenibacillus apii]
MPWPMVHFAIPEILTDGNSTPDLLLGSIAPDAIHMRGYVSREEKGVTHLVHNDKLPAKELIMEKCREYLSKRSETEWKEFVLGYFLHIYTDLRWTDTVYEDFENNYKGEKIDIRKTYNHEVSQAEFNLIRSLDSTEKLFALLLKAKGFTIDPFVTQLEVNQYRDRKVEWLQDLKNEPRIKPIYFKTDKINRFFNETSKELKELL